MKLNTLLKATGLLGAGALLSMAAASASADQEYLLTVTRPSTLQVIDMSTNKVARSCKVPGTFGSGSIAPSPDGKIAYVLNNKWEDVYGIDIRTCDITFHAAQSHGNITVKSFVSLAVSSDGKELYTVQNPVRHLSDRYEVMHPQLAVFNTADGMNAKPVRTFPVDRRITKIAATDTGEVILGGADIKAINVKTGKIRMVTPLQHWDRGPLWSPPDAFAMGNQGEQSHEYIMPYTAAKFKDKSQDMNTAEWWWGMSRVDLKTGKAERTETVPFQFILFAFVTDPNDPNILYGSFNSLAKLDIKQHKTLEVQDLPHTYYTVNISHDGKTLYVGGTSSDISIHDAKTLKKIGSIQLSGDMSTGDTRVATIRD